MEISIPHDAEMLAKRQAAAAGFDSIDEYVANLIRRQPAGTPPGSRSRGFQELRQLRQELPKLSTAEILRSVHEARADLL
jgi:hypothetical protein